ncbi:AraC family transcriptional regulator [Prosthecomicrobium pneumaticum]|uniref:AraC-like DNA-binding protein n=1 Tax=Prosthecomicrobium pneumaticum TaxID=81895 RepID=A0A7W9FP67_9HYPH|nr:AraC family transcriptional regulator [Prosthecomicrobium pneumaticum]MBB5754330.1 AraC-like DNA-binding protein [Prosthecomicrobium pneumaticum]
MDPLSDVLSLLKPRSYMFGGFDAGGDWSFGFRRHDGIKCYSVAHGGCWLAVEGVDAPVRLEAGDCFLLPRGRPFRLASDLDLPPADYRTILPTRPNGGLALVKGGGAFTIVGGHFTLEGEHADLLLGMLPPIVHLREEADRAALRFAVERMRQELSEPRPGGYLIAQHLAYMLLIEALRRHLAEGMKGGVGWLFALADRPMRAAIEAVHADPARRWTLAALAALAGMSRSSFALRFRQTVGMAPIDYLTRWRMTLAADRLVRSGEPVGTIALSLGYESESAFSTAFKRVTGCAPRAYGRRGATAMEEKIGKEEQTLTPALSRGAGEGVADLCARRSDASSAGA